MARSKDHRELKNRENNKRHHNKRTHTEGREKKKRQWQLSGMPCDRGQTGCETKNAKTNFKKNNEKIQKLDRKKRLKQKEKN